MRITKIIYSLIFLSVLQNLQHLNAQNPTTNVIGNVSIASPNAASLGKYADYPVNYHTGTPQINIPIYTAKSGGLEMPVSLSYHASGLKVQEAASWVGGGWALNAGGMITRSVMSLPDDKGLNSGGNQTQYGHWSNYGYSSYLLLAPNLPDDLGFSQGRKDGEPDMYFFNFGNYMGKFYFRDDRTPVLVPEQDFKIIPDSGFISTPYNNGYCFKGFTIITPDGNKYYFGSTGNNGATMPVEVTSPFTIDGGLINGTAISSWYLNKMVSKDGIDSITLNYSPENYSYYTLSMFPLVSSNLIGKYEYKPLKQFIQGVRLSSIVFPEGQINFNTTTARIDLSAFSPQIMYETPNTEAKSLASIQINNNSQLCKQFNFYYGYFHDAVNGLNGQLNSWLGSSNIQSDAYKLRLDSIKETSCNGSISVPPFKFSYYGEPVARNLAFSMDHWGFNNGITTNSTLIPTYSVNNSSVVFGADREAHWPAMRGGTLQQITYPTGGYTQLNYEPHNIFGQNTNNWSNVNLAYAFYGLYGQGAGVVTRNFSTNAVGAITIYMTSTSNYSSSLVIKDVNNNTVYSTSLPNWDGFTGNNVNSTNTVTLIPGSYTVTISPTGTTNYSLVTGAVTATLTQWQNNTSFTTLTVGGLRINSITNYDPVSLNSTVTNYSYITPSSGHSSGSLYSIPAYVCIIRNDGYGMAMGNCPNYGYNTNGCASMVGQNIGEAVYFVSPSSVRPMVSAKGNHIGYDFVKVSQSGNGYSSYEYYDDYANYTPWVPAITNGDVAVRNVNTTTCSATSPSFPYAPIPFNFMTGELKHEAHFNQSGQLLKETWNYPVYTPDLDGTPGYIAQQLTTDPTGGGVFVGTEYMLYSAAKTQDKTIETVYDPANNNQATSTNLVNYGSGFHHEPTQKIMINSTGDTLATNMKYSFDYRIAQADALTNPLNSYLSAVTSATITLNSMITSGCLNDPNVCNINSCSYNAVVNYRITKSLARVSYLQTRKTNFNAPNSQFNVIHANAKANADAELKPVLELQDEFDNSVIETSQWKKGSFLSSSFTRYDYVNNPSGIVYPQKTQTINITTPSSAFTNSATSASGTSITKDSRYTDESVFHFNAGRIADVTPKNNVTTAYIWGYGNQLPVAKITGATYAAVIGLVNQSVINNMTTPDATMRSVLNSLRTGLPNAFVNTYTHSPITGMTSETDPRGRITFYEYDALGRLALTRDNENNILKKICYNYAGQPESCGTSCTNTTANWQNTTTPLSCQQGNCGNNGYQEQEQKDINVCSPTYFQTRWIVAGYNPTACVPSTTTPNWQNTSTPPTCQQNSCGNTGYQLQEQRDMNPCSPTYNQTQFVTVYNPSACPSSNNVTLTYQNGINISGFTAVYTDYYTNQTYSYNIPGSGSGTLGCNIPPGYYTVSISKPGNTMYTFFDIGCRSTSGTSAYFSKAVYVSSTTCNYVSIGYAY